MHAGGAALLLAIGAGILLPGSAAAFEQPDAAAPLPARVTVIDGSTGEPLRGAQVEWSGRPMVAEGDGFVLPDAALKRGAAGWVPLAVALPPGYVRDEGEGRSRDASLGHVTVYSRGVTLTVVAWPEVPIRVTVCDADGHPIQGASLRARRCGKRTLRETGEPWATNLVVCTSEREYSSVGSGCTGDDGASFLRGVPWIPGDAYEVTAWYENDGECRQATSKGLRLTRDPEVREVRIELPREAQKSFIGGYSSRSSRG